GGLELALACDLLVAARGAKLGIPEVGVGLFAAGAGLFRLPSRVGYATAMEMAVTGDPISSEEAADKGLVSRLTAEGEALSEAIALAERIARNAPLAVAASKALVRATQGATEQELWEAQKPFMKSVWGSSDAKEGPRAFAEKRPPEWTGT
ncbi:MAG TPA: enoyl-CoA hydratase, partial [Acidimicrobiaceae bacterium]|nr:enoyl-CoA hydratase [Acidimicrobiaceae bacterium]